MLDSFQWTHSFRLMFILNLQTHLYLSLSIANPKPVFKAIPSRVASKLRRNCSEDFFLSNRLEEYKKLPYINQGYSAGLVNKELSRAEKIPCSHMLKPKDGDSKKKIIPFILTIIQIYHIQNSLIKKHFHLLESSLFIFHPFIYSFIIHFICLKKNNNKYNDNPAQPAYSRANQGGLRFKIRLHYQ